MDEYAVIVDGLVKRYGKTFALKGLSFNVYRGEILGLLGPNGAGKTTTLRAIAGSLKPTKGGVLVFGHDSFREYVKVRSMIGVVPELPSLSPELTVFDNLYFIGRIHGLGKDVVRERIEELADLLDISGLLRYRYAGLSKGLKRRVDIAAALIHDPELLLLDEPTTGLDVVSASTLREYISELVVKAGKTVILSSHYIDEVMNMAHRVVVLVNGVKLVEGTPTDLRAMLKLDKKIVLYVDRRIETRDLDKIKDVLEAEKIGHDLKNHVRTLEFRSTNVVLALSRISLLLEEMGYRLTDIEIIPPSWSDIFKTYIDMFSRKNCEACPLYRGGCIG